MARRDPPTRRQVIVGGAMGLIGAATLPACRDRSVSIQGGRRDTGPRDLDSGASVDAAADAGRARDAGEVADVGTPADAGERECTPTVAQAEGPFGQGGLERTNLDLHGHTGVPFTLEGQVLDRACQPVAGARVLLWHASPSPPGAMPQTLTEDRAYTAAVYDHPLEAGAITPDGQTVPTRDRQYYGWLTTDADGRYRFQSLRPGWYLNGATYRASHLHVQVIVAGATRLTSQVYFPDDPFNDRDGIYNDCTPLGSCTMQIDAAGAGAYDLVLTA